MVITDQTTLRELEDLLEREGFAYLRLRSHVVRTEGSVPIRKYEAILHEGHTPIDEYGENRSDGEGASIAEAISDAYKRSKE